MCIYICVFTEGRMQTRRLNALTPSTEHLRSGVRRNLIDCISWPLPSNGCKSLLVIKPAAPMKYQPMSTNLNLTRAQYIINWLHANSTQKMSHQAESSGDQQLNEDANQTGRPTSSSMSRKIFNTAETFIPYCQA